MNEKILSQSEIDTVRSGVADFSRSVNEFVNQIDDLIACFSNDHIVETFFQSGEFGEKQQENIGKIREITNDLSEQMSTVLISATNEYLDSMQRLLATGKH